MPCRPGLANGRNTGNRIHISLPYPVFLAAAFSLLFLSCLTVSVSDSVTVPADAEQQYRILAEGLRSGAMTIDFSLLRRCSMALPDFDPFNSTATVLALEADLREGKLESAKSKAITGFVSCAADIEYHRAAAKIYQALGEPEQARFHGELRERLLGSILSGGSGDSPERALTVIHYREVAAICEILAFRPVSPHHIGTTTRELDLYAGTDHSGKKTALYFDVTLIYRWLIDSLLRTRSS